MFRSITCKITLCLAKLWISILYHLSDRVIGHLTGAVFRIYIWSHLLLFGLAALSIHQEPYHCSNYQENKDASDGSNDGCTNAWSKQSTEDQEFIHFLLELQSWSLQWIENFWSNLALISFQYEEDIMYLGNFLCYTSLFSPDVDKELLHVVVFPR